VALVPVDDLSDPRIADYRNLPDAELLRDRAIFIAEGRLVVRRLLTSSRFRARSVLVTPPAYDSLRDLLDTVELPVFVASQALLNDITGFNIHRGCLAIAERGSPLDWRTLTAASRLVLIEQVANADNVGAIFRNAAAFGADAILLESSSTDPLYRKAIRTSMGAALWLPFARLEPWPEALTELRSGGTTLIGLTTDATQTIDVVVQRVRDRSLGLLLGHEGNGLTAHAREACDHLARIPMAHGVDSLNVATAAAVALYELSRSSTVR